ncbi:hypothetical protein [Halioxenophilus aromaticivorans]|uniref:MetA-pathway of phenol degradation n=1 Tax=Halioxenophilus aromaticivorans TaxID=1306992 RepID=A0AAV3TYM2_9ALTE
MKIKHLVISLNLSITTLVSSICVAQNGLEIFATSKSNTSTETADPADSAGAAGAGAASDSKETDNCAGFADKTRTVPSLGLSDDGDTQASVKVIYDSGYCGTDQAIEGSFIERYRSQIGLDFAGTSIQSDLDKAAQQLTLIGGDIDLFYDANYRLHKFSFTNKDAKDEQVPWGTLYFGFAAKYSVLTDASIAIPADDSDLTNNQSSGVELVEVDTEVVTPALGFIYKTEGGPTLSWYIKKHYVMGSDEGEFAQYIDNRSSTVFSAVFPFYGDKFFVGLERAKSFNGGNGLLTIKIGSNFSFLGN